MDRDPMHEVFSHTIYLAHENSKRKKQKQNQNNSESVVWNMEGRNVGSIRVKGPKQGLTSAKNLTIGVP